MKIIKKILNYELYEVDNDAPLWKIALAWTLYLTLIALIWTLVFSAGGR